MIPKRSPRWSPRDPPDDPEEIPQMIPQIFSCHRQPYIFDLHGCHVSAGPTSNSTAVPPGLQSAATSLLLQLFALMQWPLATGVPNLEICVASCHQVTLCFVFCLRQSFARMQQRPSLWTLAFKNCWAGGGAGPLCALTWILFYGYCF